MDEVSINVGCNAKESAQECMHTAERKGGKEEQQYSNTAIQQDSNITLSNTAILQQQSTDNIK
jgi:hypothetical protein